MSLKLDCSTVIPMSSLVGQEKCKTAFEEKIQAAESGAPFTSIAMFDPPGLGKTALGQAVGCEMATRAGYDVFYVNLKGKHNLTDKSTGELLNAIYDSHQLGGTPTLVICDEIFTKESGGSLTGELAAILSKVGGNARGGESFKMYGFDTPIKYQPKKLAFMLLSWDPRRAAGDIRTRFPQDADFVLQPYTAEELAEILRIQSEIYSDTHAEGMKLDFTPYALKVIARSLRGTARSVETVCKHWAIKTVNARGGWKLTKSSVLSVMQSVGVYPFGLSRVESKILQFLDQHRTGYKLGDLMLKTGESRENLSKAILYLQEQLGQGMPFVMVHPDTEEVLTNPDGSAQAGALIMPHGGKFFLTEHGVRIVNICRKGGFLNAE